MPSGKDAQFQINKWVKAYLLRVRHEGISGEDNHSLFAAVCQCLRLLHGLLLMLQARKLQLRVYLKVLFIVVMLRMCVHTHVHVCVCMCVCVNACMCV